MSPYYAKAYMQERLREAQRMRETRLIRHALRSQGERRSVGNALSRRLSIIRGRLGPTTSEQAPCEAA